MGSECLIYATWVWVWDRVGARRAVRAQAKAPWCGYQLQVLSERQQCRSLVHFHSIASVGHSLLRQRARPVCKLTSISAVKFLPNFSRN